MPVEIIMYVSERWTFQAAREEAEKASPYFVLLRAAGDLLMLPKEMLMDKAVRTEVPHPPPCSPHLYNNFLKISKNMILKCKNPGNILAGRTDA